MVESFQTFVRVLVQVVVSLGGTLVYAALLIFISRVVDDLRLELLFKRVTAFSKLLVTLFLAGVFLAPFNLIYNKLHIIISSGAAPIARLGQTAEGVVLLFVLYSIYKSFKPPTTIRTSEQESESQGSVSE